MEQHQAAEPLRSLQDDAVWHLMETMRPSIEVLLSKGFTVGPGMDPCLLSRDLHEMGHDVEGWCYDGLLAIPN